MLEIYFEGVCLFKFLIIFILFFSSMLYATVQDNKLLEYKIEQLIKEKNVLESQMQSLMQDRDILKLKVVTIKENYVKESENNRNLYDKQLTTFQVILGVVGVLFLFVTIVGINNIKGYVVKLINDKANDKIKEFDNTIKKYKDLLETIKNKTEEEIKDFIKNKAETLSLEDKELLKKLSEEVKNKQDKTENDWYVLAMQYNNKKDYINAIYAYKKTIELNQNNIAAWNNLGVIYSEIQDYKKAIKTYKAALSINDNYSLANLNLGNTYGRIGEYENAINLYKKVSVKDKLFSDSFISLYEILILTNIEIEDSLKNSFLENFSSNKENMIQYEMLEIIKDIKNKKNIDIKLQNWKKMYKDVSLGNWRFKELEDFINIESSQTIKSNLHNAVEVFKNHNENL